MPDSKFVIADARRVEAVLDRLARQLTADLGSSFTLVGIRRRGVPLAEMVLEALEDTAADEVEFGELTLKRYADDLSLLHEEPRMDEPELPFEANERTIVLVDDVVYTGRTLLKAAAYLLSAGARRVVTAALCDRRRREAPLAASFVGLRLDVSRENVVDVHVPPYEDDLSIVVTTRERVGGEG